MENQEIKLEQRIHQGNPISSQANQSLLNSLFNDCSLVDDCLIFYRATKPRKGILDIY